MRRYCQIRAVVFIYLLVEQADNEESN